MVPPRLIWFVIVFLASAFHRPTTTFVPAQPVEEQMKPDGGVVLLYLHVWIDG